jgi:predicted acyl esterase
MYVFIFSRAFVVVSSKNGRTSRGTISAQFSHGRLRYVCYIEKRADSPIIACYDEAPLAERLCSSYLIVATLKHGIVKDGCFVDCQ